MKSLGQRYERLLVLAAPLLILALLVLLISIAAENQEEYFQGRCYGVAADILVVNEAALSSYLPPPKANSRLRREMEIEYSYRVKLAMINGLSPSSKCYKFINGVLGSGSFTPPKELAEKWRSKTKEVVAAPIQYAGIEIPDRASLGLFGTVIKVELLVLIQALQFALAPIILLWLGSLYNTRFRETQFNGAAKAITDVFPHVLNVYPVGRFHEARKKSWVQYYYPKIVFGVAAISRMTLVSVFVAPPVVAYLASLFFMQPSQIAWVIYGSGAILGVYLLSILSLELAPWHVQKAFPGRFVFKL